MPSKSKAQQRFMGLVHAYNKGDVKGSEVSKKVKDAADSMKKSDVKKYASTTHKGKPEKVNKEWIVKTIKELTNTEMESCGYTTSAVDPNYKLKSPGGTGKVDKKLKELAEKMGGCLCEKCWKGYKIHPTQKTKELFGKKYPNCVKAESVNEGKKRFKVGFNIGKAKYVISFHDGKSKHKDGSDFFGIETFRNQKEFEKGKNDLRKKGYIEESVNENVLNEMDYRGFIKYMNDFYGPKGVYPDKKKRTLGQKEIGMAYSVLLKKKPNFEIGFDSTDREMLRDILIKLRKLDPDYSQKKESVKEAVDKKQGAEILKQLGGNRFIMMTGAKHFGVGKEGLSFKIGRNSKQVNHIKIDYDRGRDLYNMKFDWVTKRGIKNKKTVKGVYADQLQRVFSMHTGMATKF